MPLPDIDWTAYLNKPKSISNAAGSIQYPSITELLEFEKFKQQQQSEDHPFKLAIRKIEPPEAD